MADIRADGSRRSQPDLRVHIGAIHIDLPARLMHGAADVPDAGLEYAMRAGIGDHQRRDFAAMQRDFGGEIFHVDIAVAVAAHHDHLIARHRGGGRVGAVRGGWDEADIPRPLPARFVPGADGKQPGIFALRAGIGLQRHPGKTGYGF